MPGLDDISEGLVISDVENDTENKGNQFVWIPVTDISNFKQIEGYRNDSLQSYLNNNDCIEPYGNADSEAVIEYNKMKKSVEKNQGFYCGRFETGKENEEAVVKKDKIVFNGIKWGNSITDSKGGAVEEARNFAKRNGYTSVASTLC